MQELDWSNAVFSSPLASSPLSVVYVDEICVFIVVRVLVTLAAAVSAPLMPDAPSTALLIESASVFRSVESWSIESLACWPAVVFGLPSALRSV